MIKTLINIHGFRFLSFLRQMKNVEPSKVSDLCGKFLIKRAKQSQNSG